MKQRIITAVIAAAVFLPIIIAGGLPLLALVYLMATIGLYELIRMKKTPLFSVPSVISFILLWILLLPADGEILNYLTSHGYDKSQMVLIGILLYLLASVITKNKFTFDDAGFMVISVLYVGMGFYYLFVTREVGIMYIFLALFTIWATDSGAYFIGKAFGKNKLWPTISPNKTVEGFVGGIISALVVGVLFLLFTDMSAVKLLTMSIVIAIFGQLGDLVQSAYKRHYGVKDSGKILPGHGGILDRFDSLLFILPILHFLHFL